MATPRLTAVSRLQGNNAALKAGDISVHGYELDWQDEPVLINAFRRMVRELAFDVSEMAITTYLCARAHGVRFAAIPIFLARGLHHGAITVNRRFAMESPKGLEGQRVAVGRGYTVTTGVWARAILQDEFDVDLDRVIWLRSGDEHVAEYVPPANVESATEVEIQDLLLSGSVAAAINFPVKHPDIQPMIADPLESGIRSLVERGFYPINHLIVVRDDVLAAHPGLAIALFEAFAESKRVYVKRLREGSIDAPAPEDLLFERIMAATGTDPLPYGIEPNRVMLEALIDHAVSQHIVPAGMTPESVFERSTQHLVG